MTSFRMWTHDTRHEEGDEEMKYPTQEERIVMDGNSRRRRDEVIAELRAELARLHPLADGYAGAMRELEMCRAEVSSWLTAVAPELEPLPTVSGQISQLNNYCFGLRRELRETREVLSIFGTEEAIGEQVPVGVTFTLPYLAAMVVKRLEAVEARNDNLASIIGRLLLGDDGLEDEQRLIELISLGMEWHHIPGDMSFVNWLATRMEAAEARAIINVEVLAEFKELAEAAEARAEASPCKCASHELPEHNGLCEYGRVIRERDEAQAHAARLTNACKQLISYRDRTGSINFQLEKADDYHRMIRAALAASSAEALTLRQQDTAYLAALEAFWQSIENHKDALILKHSCSKCKPIRKSMDAVEAAKPKDGER